MASTHGFCRSSFQGSTVFHGMNQTSVGIDLLTAHPRYWRIEIPLRPYDEPDKFLPLEDLVHILCHETAHCWGKSHDEYSEND
jgi:hypothetical protein